MPTRPHRFSRNLDSYLNYCPMKQKGTEMIRVYDYGELTHNNYQPKFDLIVQKGEV